MALPFVSLSPRVRSHHVEGATGGSFTRKEATHKHQDFSIFIFFLHASSSPVQFAATFPAGNSRSPPTASLGVWIAPRVASSSPTASAVQCPTFCIAAPAQPSSPCNMGSPNSNPLCHHRHGQLWTADEMCLPLSEGPLVLGSILVHQRIGTSSTHSASSTSRRLQVGPPDRVTTRLLCSHSSAAVTR